MKMDKIKPCPFCGGKGKITLRQLRTYGQYTTGQRKIKYAQQVICQRCHARGSLFSAVVSFPSLEHQYAFAWLEEKAIEAWNTREKEIDTRSEQQRWLEGE